jgi:O-antigen/teichoic acid export membrane protein
MPSQRSFGSLLAHNAMLGFGSQLLVACAAIVLIPTIIDSLGTSAYGLLAIALVLFGGFSLLDAGLGRATTKYVSEYIAKQDLDRLTAVFWASLCTQTALGIAGGALLAALTPWLVTNALAVPVGMHSEATNTLYVLCASAPIVLAASTLRSTLEGAQRFDIVTAVKTLLNLSTYAIPVVLVGPKTSVAQIVTFLALARLAAMLAFLVCCFRSFPVLLRFTLPRSTVLTSLLTYSGWVAISNMLTPVLVQIDRFLVAGLLGLSAVAFYAAPYELLYGLWIIPSSIAAVLLPAFSALNGQRQTTIANLYVRSIKYILVLLGPAVALFIAFADVILDQWLGASFSQAGSSVLRILAVGVLINSLAWVPISLLGGLGRPDVLTKNHLLQVPLYIAVAYPLIAYLGLTGAAIAFGLRVTFEAIFLFRSAYRLAPETTALFHDVRFRNAGMCVLLFTAPLACAGLFEVSVWWRLGLAGTTLVGYAVSTWWFTLDNGERAWTWRCISLSTTT